LPDPGRPATVYDVAARAGVSVATVSRFLAGSGYVGESARAKVAAAVAVLDYVPNRAAASLKSKRSGLIGFVVSDLQNPFVAELAASIGAQARVRGYGMVLADSQGHAAHSVEAIELLRSHGVDGMIVTPPESAGLNELLLSMYAMGIPLVGIGLHTTPQRIDVATVDTRSGAVAAVRHLIDLGHQRIAMIGSRTLGRGRRDAYRHTLRAAELPVLRELFRTGTLDRAGGVIGARALLALDQPPTAIFAANDSVALGVLQEAGRQGLRVPHDLSLVGFDDGDLAEHATPPLTTVAQPKAELGRHAVDLLVARATGSAGAGPVEIALSCELVIRQSTAPPDV
jgi:DNA-binding LacI/PurR family transcriptional regulator